ncbi:hypothetical protein C9374_006644 [Naegleria lovaniensis]|uniref:Uncharacterized protein n=1 Tax=Naegleria lovaniensis TaxID=51637 RepID=A0AA88KGV8_NAELO|nr:uncharacterized protein C9374_006644 [Naegleria lovaniensis]KAG2379527.1 hypothetical protein C9374_006644 [Naegleria lovaniensis]
MLNTSFRKPSSILKSQCLLSQFQQHYHHSQQQLLVNTFSTISTFRNDVNKYARYFSNFNNYQRMASLTSSMGLGRLGEKTTIEKNRFPMIKTRSGKHIQYVDQCVVKVRGGAGGDGHVHFLREKFKPIGKASGGDGGSGGSVFIKASMNRHSLCGIDYIQKAKDGDNGQKRNKNGKKGEPTIIYVPTGTQVFDADTGDIIADLQNDGDEILVAKGGRGGLGNQHYSSSTNRSPKQSQEGQKGESRHLLLKLKTIADVGLLGFPNAGKSTLLGAISNAKPKVAAYSFTTLHPTVGEVFHQETGYSFTCADIPGLIEGMNSKLKTRGLGHDFMQHIERTKLLLYVVDVSGLEGLGIQYNEETGEIKYEFITDASPFDYHSNTSNDDINELSKHSEKRVTIPTKQRSNVQQADEDLYHLRESAMADYFGEDEAEDVLNELDDEDDDTHTKRMSKRQKAQHNFRKRTPLLRTLSPDESAILRSNTKEHTTSAVKQVGLQNEEEFDDDNSMTSTFNDDSIPATFATQEEIQHDTKDFESSLQLDEEFNSQRDLNDEENLANDDPYRNTVLDTLPEVKRKQRLFQPWDILRLLQKEVELYMPGLSDRAACIIANKMDVPGSEKNFEKLKEFVKNEFGDIPIIPISAKDGLNVEQVKLFCISYLERRKKKAETTLTAHIDE